ncbi:membrane protein [Allostella vacuolata]|nr:membrane protein [Stella vacuolata]
MAKAADTRDRDLRLDFFRGLALWFIFLNHMQYNVLTWATNRNYGFSDATEIFVFISGYSAAIAYGAAMERQGFVLAAARILRRVWQIYVAHLMLFLAFTAEIAFLALRFDNQMFVEEMNVLTFLDEPHVTLIQALLLKFRPVNMDVLPLYIVLLAAFPAVLWAVMRKPLAVMLASLVLYVAARRYGWNLPNYPGDAGWFFNPFTWQVLFVMGAVATRMPALLAWLGRQERWLAPLAVVYLAFALWVALSWNVTALDGTVPPWLARLLYPIDKTLLDPLRALHFLALAYLTARWVGPQAAFLSSRLARPLVICGQHSLAVFCVGTFLSFTGEFVLLELDGSLATQIAVGCAGFVLMTLLAAVLGWYKAADKASARQPRLAAAE